MPHMLGGKSHVKTLLDVEADMNMDTLDRLYGDVRSGTKHWVRNKTEANVGCTCMHFSICMLAHALGHGNAVEAVITVHVVDACWRVMYHPPATRPLPAPLMVTPSKRTPGAVTHSPVRGGSCMVPLRMTAPGQ